MKFSHGLAAFFAVPFLWAGLALVLGRRLVGPSQLVLLAAVSFVFAMIWLAFVNSCAGRLRRGQPPTIPLHVATAVAGSGLPAVVFDLIETHDLAGAVELAAGVMGLALVSSLLFVVVAGLPWRHKAQP